MTRNFGFKRLFDGPCYSLIDEDCQSDKGIPVLCKESVIHRFGSEDAVCEGCLMSIPWEPVLFWPMTQSFAI